MANIISDKYKALNYSGRDYPLLKGDVKFTLKNVHNGKTETYEDHNMITNALANIFRDNYGGALNYDNFSNMYSTWLGGVLLFGNQLDISSAGAVDDYGIPAYTDNPVVAHAGQTILTDQADDTTRGNPDSVGTMLTANSTKLTFTWGTSAGNGTINSLGLTHTDVGSYGSGVNSTAQTSLNPFADVASVSRAYGYDDNGNCILGIHNNIAYNVYLVSDTVVHIFKTPINCTKFKLQGGSLTPLTDYTVQMTVNLDESYGRRLAGDFYYNFDFDNNKLLMFGVPTRGGNVLLQDSIDLDSGAVTHRKITISGAQLWKFDVWQEYDTAYHAKPTQAMIKDGYVYVYTYASTYYYPTGIIKVSLTTSDVGDIDCTLAPSGYFAYRSNLNGYHKIGERFISLGGMIVHRSFLINGDKVFPVSNGELRAYYRDTLTNNKISSPRVNMNANNNIISVCKLYLATKWNLPTPVTKTASQAMTVEYTLTEV